MCKQFRNWSSGSAGKWTASCGLGEAIRAGLQLPGTFGTDRLLHAFVGVPHALLLADVQNLADVIGVMCADVRN